MIFRLIAIERSGRKILIVARGEDRKRYIFTVTNFFPFFYIRVGVNVPSQFKKHIVELIKGNWKTLDGIPMNKVVVDTPDIVAEIRDSLPLEATGEADVIYTTRFAIEAKIRTGYFKVKNSNSSSKMNIKFEQIVPIDDANFFIPVREGQLDEEAVKGNSVLISVWDSYTNKIYSVGWNKYGKSKQYEDIFKGLIKRGDKSVYELELPRSVHMTSSKQEMFKVWTKLMKKLELDVLGGWYIKGYDIPQIFSEANSVGYGLQSISPFNSAPAPEKIKGLVQFDMLDGVKRMESTNIRSYKLPNVMKSFFKAKVPSNPKEIPNIWKKYFPLVDYNSSHTDACRFMSQELGVIEFIYQLVYLCCVRFDDAESGLRLIDALMLSIKDEDKVYPNRPAYEEGKNSEEVRGAFVVEPIPGIVYEYIPIFDYKRLYPSAMISTNSGIETLDPNGKIIVRIKNANGKVIQIVRFTDKKKSELRGVFDYLFAFRDRIQEQIKIAIKEKQPEKVIENLKKKDMGAKIATNTVYGGTGNASFRLFKKVVQACTTQVARDAEEWMWGISTNTATELGVQNRITAGDSVIGNTELIVNKKKININKLFLKYNQTKNKRNGKDIINVSNKNLFTPSVSEKGKIENKQILKIIRHKTKKKLYKIKTESGKSIIVTEDEGILVYEKNKIKTMTPTECIGKEIFIPVSEMNTVECFECHKIFKCVTNTHLKKEHNMTTEEYKLKYPNQFLNNIESNRGNIPWNKNKTWNNQVLRKLRKSHLGQISWNTGLTKETDIRVKRHAKSVSIANSNMSEQGRKNISKAMKLKWKDKEYSKNQIKALCISPNNLEQLFINSFKFLKFTGDGKLFVGRKCPDFKVKGKQKLIEIFGEYWHYGDNPKSKIKYFRKYGWDCIVIWESEIKTNFKKVSERVIDYASN